MANLNKVFLMGNITRDPELRYLPSGTAVTTFTVAVNRTYTLQTGERKQEVLFMPVVVWGKRAETCGEFLNKGSGVFIDGRLRSRSWQGQDGQKRSTTEVIADNVQFLGKGKKEEPPVDAIAPGAQEPLDSMPDIDVGQDNPRSKERTEDEVPF